MIEWRFTRGVQPQTEKFMEGFGEVIPIEWLQYFDEAELEMILCGVQNIDIADWEKNTVLKNYQKNSKQVSTLNIIRGGILECVLWFRTRAHYRDRAHGTAPQRPLRDYFICEPKLFCFLCRM